MSKCAKNAVIASFVADSLALGAHWIYDTQLIDETIGRVDRLLPPPKDGYHPTKTGGDQTHYGDQTLVLLASIAANKRFERDHFARQWQALFDAYDGYVDHATKITLQNLAQGRPPKSAGSTSTDFSGAARIAPVIPAHHNDPDAMVEAVRAQTALTHNHPLVLDSAEFLARVVLAVLKGAKPLQAVQRAKADHFDREPFAQWIEAGIASAGRPTREVIKQFGQMCAVEGALPAVIHLTARYEDNLPEALIENVMAGGDSAARGMAVGMILGAAEHAADLPSSWLEELKNYTTLTGLLDAF